MSAEPSPQLAVRCDGGEQIGAGHVARCLPLADAFGGRGWTVVFVGRFSGFAGWLLQQAGWPTRPPEPGRPCGVPAGPWAAALVDSYDFTTLEICALAERLPIATVGEAARCGDEGILIDYHLDRLGEAPGPRLLPGPAYAPLDPGLAGAGRAGHEVESVLITVGGSDAALGHLSHLRELVGRTFPTAEQLVPRGGSPSRGPMRLRDLLDRVDLAVSAAGFTAYELACAGVPQVAVGVVPNQRRVVDGLRRTGLAPFVDVTAGESIEAVGAALELLRDRGIRHDQSQRGRAMFDGRGADRAAAALLERWPVRSERAATIHAPMARSDGVR